MTQAIQCYRGIGQALHTCLVEPGILISKK
jgi:hypothetical protein